MALREKNTNPSSSREKAPTIADAALLGFISSLGPFAVNANVPGFHAIAADMGVSFIAVQLSLTVYLATYAVASLFVGAVSDSLGRKPVIIAGMLLFMVASLGAALATTIEVFYFWRFVQGLTAAAGQVVTQAVVRDRWAGLGAARMNALIAMFFAVSPALAPVVGGTLIVRFSWHAVLVFLIVYAGLIALLLLFLFRRRSRRLSAGHSALCSFLRTTAEVSQTPRLWRVLPHTVAALWAGSSTRPAPLTL